MRTKFDRCTPIRNDKPRFSSFLHQNDALKFKGVKSQQLTLRFIREVFCLNQTEYWIVQKGMHHRTELIKLNNLDIMFNRYQIKVESSYS